MATPEKLLQSVQNEPGGLTLSALLDRHPGVARRTAQRWLHRWVEEGAVRLEGLARAARYVARPADQPVILGNAANADFPAHISLSPDSRDVLAYVSQPLAARKPVGYQVYFLLDYIPGTTWYLAEPLRRQLHKMGNTGDGGQPAGTYGRAMMDRLLIDLSWASSQLEGNTYTRLDTVALIERGQTARGKAATETQMILNHKAAIELLVDNAETVRFNLYTLMNLHSALAENLLPNPADEGRVRQHRVQIAQSVYQPLSVPQQVHAQLNLLLDKARNIPDPFEQAFFMMVFIPYLQPFADVNKRLSRLAANLPLIRANLCPLTFVGVPQAAYVRAVLGVYELTRVELLRDVFVWAYERSTQEYLTVKQGLAEPDPTRLRYRQLVKSIVARVVRSETDDPMPLIHQWVADQVEQPDREQVASVVVQDLRRLHEGVLARYGLRPSELAAWQGLKARL